jgi:hypothetical protein
MLLILITAFMLFFSPEGDIFKQQKFQNEHKFSLRMLENKIIGLI